jgi:uracil-DNA glycosylase
MNLSNTNIIIINPDVPYVLKHPEEKSRREKMLTQPHMKPLTEYLQQVRTAMGSGYEMPMFDPCDGGINARVLFLLEAPGPKAVGSAFISRNNPDPTAQNMCELLKKASIARHDTLLWNIVPWYVGDGEGRIRAVTKADIDAAMPHLKNLPALLPKLEMIVLVGKKAQSASKEIETITDLALAQTHHTSARVFNVWKHKRAESEADFARIAQVLMP